MIDLFGNRQRTCVTAVEEVRRILASARQSYSTFYWLAVETRMHGELRGLRGSDFDLEQGLVAY